MYYHTPVPFTKFLGAFVSIVDREFNESVQKLPARLLVERKKPKRHVKGEKESTINQKSGGLCSKEHNVKTNRKTVRAKKVRNT